MTRATLLVWAVCLLQIGAGLAYAAQRQWHLAGVWFFVGVANVCLALMDNQ